MKPFDNSQWQVDTLVVDSAEDVIAIHGSLDIRRDQGGLAKARALAAYFQAATACLLADERAGRLPARLANIAAVEKDNPFA